VLPPPWAQRAGLSYRQLDYWTRQGWLLPTQEYAGPGFPRAWPRRERSVAVLMARLVDAGVVPAVAARAARRVVQGSGSVDLGNGIELVVKATKRKRRANAKSNDMDTGGVPRVQRDVRRDRRRGLEDGELAAAAGE